MGSTSSLAALLAFSASLGCAHGYAEWSADTFGAVPIDAPPSTATAHVLLEERVLRFEEDEGVVVSREFTHRMVRLQSPAGQDERFVGLAYSSTFARVEATVLRPVTSSTRRASARTCSTATAAFGSSTFPSSPAARSSRA